MDEAPDPSSTEYSQSLRFMEEAISQLGIKTSDPQENLSAVMASLVVYRNAWREIYNRQRGKVCEYPDEGMQVIGEIFLSIAEVQMRYLNFLIDRFG